jgi:Na+/proline symporter
VCQGQFVPAAVAPKLVHRVGHFHDRDVFVQWQAFVIRESGLVLPASGISGVVLINDPAAALVQGEGAYQFLFGDRPVQIAQRLVKRVLSCKSLKDAQKNMYTYGFAFTPVNFLFLALGVLLLTLAAQRSIQLPTLNDDILPMFCTSGILGGSILIFFTIGIIAAAFSSADSALTALTTSFCVDILGVQREEAKRAKRTRLKVHVMISVLFVLIILAFKAVNNRSVIDAIYMIASYTYGPLLGLFVFGLFTKRNPRDKYVPYICIASPLICLATDFLVKQYAGYTFGYEMLMVNGGITFAGLWLSAIENGKLKIEN